MPTIAQNTRLQGIFLFLRVHSCGVFWNITVYQRSQWILGQSGFTSSFDAQWSKWSQTIDPFSDHPRLQAVSHLLLNAKKWARSTSIEQWSHFRRTAGERQSHNCGSQLNGGLYWFHTEFLMPCTLVMEWFDWLVFDVMSDITWIPTDSVCESSVNKDG